MLLHRYWSKAESDAVTPNGKRVSFACWRGSASSLAEARALAREAAARMAARISRGEGFPERYAYAERPLREEILQEHHSNTGQLEAVITRNRYGALVLNAARAMFIDVDLPRPRLNAPILQRLLNAILRRPPLPAPDVASSALQRLHDWLSTRPDWGVRVYRTHSGLRYLVTHDLFEPASAASEEAMQFLGSDPFYIRLCRAQKSFRARLTPKPWRCDMEAPPLRFPWQNVNEEWMMREWEARYERATRGYAACTLMEAMGQARSHSALEPIIRLHDSHTRAESDLPLA